MIHARIEFGESVDIGSEAIVRIRGGGCSYSGF
jgi:hypothetical protein